MANTVNLEFAGDAGKLAAASKRAEQSVATVGTAATEASDDLARASKEGGDLTGRLGSLGAAAGGASTAIGDAAGTMQALVDIQDAARAKSARLARALNDAQQAQVDLNQAQEDGKQATLDAGQAQIDAEQAALDVAEATRALADAQKEHGAKSAEARQAEIDLKQARQDGKQATADYRQATLDAQQALVDAGSAQLDLNDAQHEANPPELQGWADQLNLIAPLLTGLVGVFSLVTAAQWAWNAAQLASPTTWIIAAVVALIAVIVLIATKTDWFQKAWSASWSWIKESAAKVGRWFKDVLWEKWIKGAWDGILGAGRKVWAWMQDLPGKLRGTFARVGDFISRPFRAAFNAVSSAWNNTVGRLSWTVPGWVPVVGGNSIAAPRLPRFHQGGTVPGAPGSEVLAMLQAGETVTSTAGSVGDGGGWVSIRGDAVLDALIQAIADRVGAKGGRAVQLGIRVAT